MMVTNSLSPLIGRLGSCGLLLATVAVVAVNARYGGHYRPYPLAMENHHGFSPYYPARINHETLPISQAEFAQLVAESMATSNGPHHHHPPNTDRNYEGPDHAAMHDSESSQHYKTHRGKGVQSQAQQGHGHHGQQQSQYQPNQRQRPVEYDQYDHDTDQDDDGQDDNSQYQPDDSYKSNHNEVDEPDSDQAHATNEYQRAPVYEGPGEEEEEVDESSNYGGRPSKEDYDQYEQGHRSRKENIKQNRHEYMGTAASQPAIRYVIDSHQA